MMRLRIAWLQHGITALSCSLDGPVVPIQERKDLRSRSLRMKREMGHQCGALKHSDTPFASLSFVPFVPNWPWSPAVQQW